MRWLLVMCLLIFAAGCEERLTKTEWNLRYPPDANAVKARLMQEAGEQKIADNAALGKIERGCVLVIIAAIVSIGILTWLKMSALIFIPASVIFGCASGITFIEFNSHYPKAIPLLGGGLVLLFGGLTVFYFVKHGNLKAIVADLKAKM